jgi:DNA repair photolyase
MYNFINYTRNPLGGSCPHFCTYCSVKNFKIRFPLLKEKYSGPIRIVEKELMKPYKKTGTYFICNMTDLFADDVPSGYISRILGCCVAYTQNKYIFQTKNPHRYHEFGQYLLDMKKMFGFKFSLGCTIETNRYINPISKAPNTKQRYEAFKILSKNIPRFVTLEPILDFDAPILAQWITDIRPDFVNIGADSKQHGLPEPSEAEILELINSLKSAGIEVRLKHNLKRLLISQYKNNLK